MYVPLLVITGKSVGRGRKKHMGNIWGIDYEVSGHRSLERRPCEKTLLDPPTVAPTSINVYPAPTL